MKKAAPWIALGAALTAALTWGILSRRSGPSYRKPPATQHLFPFHLQDQGWGFLDAAGRVVIEPRFARVDPFSEGLAVAESDEGRFGYIDPTGRFVIEPTFVGAHPFSEGLAVAFVTTPEGERAGYVDRSGRFVIPPVYDVAESFQGGLARTTRESGWGFVDRQGDFVIPPRFAEARSFVEGAAAVRVDRRRAPSERWGFIERDGRYLVEPTFSDVADFHGRMAVVQCENERFGYLDRKGALLGACTFPGDCPLEPVADVAGRAPSAWREWDACHPHTDPLRELVSSGILEPSYDRLVLRRADARMTIASLTGQSKSPLIGRRYEHIEGFSEGLAVVRDAEKGLGAIDERGRLVVPFRRDQEFHRFAEGLAAFRVGGDCDGRWGFLDRTGRVAIEPRFRLAGDFSEGLAVVCQDRGPAPSDGPDCPPPEIECGYIDKAGTEVIEARFGPALGWRHQAVARGFRHGLAAVMQDGKWGYVDRRGAWVIPPRFRGAKNFSEEGLAPVDAWGVNEVLHLDGSVYGGLEHGPVSDGLVRFVDEERRYGFKDLEGRVVIEPQFPSVSPFAEELAAVTKLEEGTGQRATAKYGFIDRAGRLVVPYRFDRALGAGQESWRFPVVSEGRAAVAVGDRAGFVDRTGAWIVEPTYTSVGCFSEGRAPVRRGELWGFVDRDGKEVIEPRFVEVFGFSEGLAPVRIDDKWGFVDLQGRVVIEPRFTLAPGRVPPVFRHGVACVAEGYIDPRGALLGPPGASCASFTHGPVGCKQTPPESVSTW